MFRRYRRYFYLLARSEQRAILALAVFMLLILAFRMVMSHRPLPEPPDMEEFMTEVEGFRKAFEADLAAARFRDTMFRAASIGSSQTGRQAYRQGPLNKRPAFRGIISINSADSADLLPLPGIGPVFAGRLIRYRDLVGGFYASEQLREVYGLSRETIADILPHLAFDTSHLRLIDLNHASFREILRHPYLEYEDVRALLRYRDVQGGFSDLEEIRESGLLSDTVYKRIQPYLRISPF